MSTTTIMAIAFLVSGGIAAWFFFRKPGANSGRDTENSRPASSNANPEDIFNIGLNPGEDGVTAMYALESCRHCRRTREFMEEHKLPFHIIYVDQFIGDQRAKLMDKVRSFNPRGSFPTVILPNGKAIVGYREQLLREAFHDTPSAT